jgi:hypothetical protein
MFFVPSFTVIDSSVIVQGYMSSLNVTTTTAFTPTWVPVGAVLNTRGGTVST